LNLLQIIFNFVVVVVVVLLSNLYKIAIFKNIQLPVFVFSSYQSPIILLYSIDFFLGWSHSI